MEREQLDDACFLSKVEMLFPQLIGDYRIQTLKCLLRFGEVEGRPCLWKSYMAGHQADRQCRLSGALLQIQQTLHVGSSRPARAS